MTETSRPLVIPLHEEINTALSRPPGWVEAWRPIPGYSYYEASNNSVWRLADDRPVQVTGGIRSIDRTVNGRFYPSTVLRARIMANSGGYAGVNLTNDQGERCNGLLVHKLILLAFAGPCPEGMETRHLVNNPLDCRWAPGETAAEVMANGGNIMNGRPSDQFGDQVRNGSRRRTEPKPDKHCIRCGDEFTGNGKRCHSCVVLIGRQAAPLLWSGMPLDKACEELDYPSISGLHALARKYGGYGRAPRHWRLRRWVTQRVRRARYGAAPRPDSAKGGDGA
jgi:hypothetical protein